MEVILVAIVCVTFLPRTQQSRSEKVGPDMSYLICTLGVLSMLAVLYSKLGQDDKSGKCLSKLLSLSDHVCRGDPSLPDEVLYGRAGYLFSLLFVQQHLGTEKINHDIINQVHIKITD